MRHLAGVGVRYPHPPGILIVKVQTFGVADELDLVASSARVVNDNSFPISARGDSYGFASNSISGSLVHGCPGKGLRATVGGVAPVFYRHISRSAQVSHVMPPPPQPLSSPRATRTVLRSPLLSAPGTRAPGNRACLYRPAARTCGTCKCVCRWT